jgi:hypothetical protein
LYDTRTVSRFNDCLSSRPMDGILGLYKQKQPEKYGM